MGYGDDPDVEPGETAIRAFVDRIGQPAESWQDDEKVLQAFEEPNRAAIKKLGPDTAALPLVAWVQFIPDTPARSAAGAVLWGFPNMLLRMRSDVADDAQGFASVRTRLGPADLATVDALITAGIASSPRGGPPLGGEPHPREPRLRPYPGASTRDQRTEGPSVAGIRPLGWSICGCCV